MKGLGYFRMQYAIILIFRISLFGWRTCTNDNWFSYPSYIVQTWKILFALRSLCGGNWYKLIPLENLPLNLALILRNSVTVAAMLVRFLLVTNWVLYPPNLPTTAQHFHHRILFSTATESAMQTTNIVEISNVLAIDIKLEYIGSSSV